MHLLNIFHTCLCWWNVKTLVCCCINLLVICFSCHLYPRHSLCGSLPNSAWLHAEQVSVSRVFRSSSITRLLSILIVHHHCDQCYNNLKCRVLGNVNMIHTFPCALYNLPDAYHSVHKCVSGAFVMTRVIIVL